MGWFSGKKEVAPSIDELAEMGDAEIKGLLKAGKVKGKSPKAIRQVAREVQRRTQGERGMGAISAARKGGGTGNRNYQNIPLKDRVHPTEYNRILEREAKRQGLI